MSSRKIKNLSKESIKKTIEIFEELYDPIKLAIVLELIRHPETTPNDLKKRISLPGSRIYHFLNKLIDKNIIEETGTEQLTSHLARRKFKVSQNFQELMKKASILGHESPDEIVKAYHLFELHSAIALLEIQLRKIRKVPVKNFRAYLDQNPLPFPNLFYLDELSKEEIETNYRTVRKKGREIEKNSESIIELIKNAQFCTLFGIYRLDETNQF